MKNVAVFCAAAEDIGPQYVAAASEVGVLLGRIGAGLVYGGARAGLMEIVAKAAKSAGAHVTGVVPFILEERDRVSLLIDEKINCRNLSERKDIMLERSDIIVALPGGTGTLDEIFHVLAAATIGYHCKRVVLYNVDGYWNGLVEVLETMKSKGFLRYRLEDFLSFAGNTEELKRIILES